MNVRPALPAASATNHRPAQPALHLHTMIAPLRIGDVQLPTNLLLAPIAGYCDLSFRLVARSCGGVGLVCTDLLCPEGLLRENRQSMALAATCPEDWPL